MKITKPFEASVRQALQDAGIDLSSLKDQAFVQIGTQPALGDYQTTIALRLAKRDGIKPMVLAEKIVTALQKKENVFASVVATAPGFVNMKLSNAFLEKALQTIGRDPRLGIQSTLTPETVVVDYSSPNVAKTMHIGHLRSTIIGDAITRLLMFLGHQVIRRNHVGDWGTQFGMLIEYLLQEKISLTDETGMESLNQWYQTAKQCFDQSKSFAHRARQRVRQLQDGEGATRAIWGSLVRLSKRHFYTIYKKLNVLLEDKDWYGESKYHNLMPDVLRMLDEKKMLHFDQGAAVVFLAGFFDRDQNPLPMIVRKSDGSYLYATSDLAAAYDRIKQCKATRLIYLVDARQRQHFEMLFAALREVGWASAAHRLQHVPFGSVLNKEGKPFKTREGHTIALEALIAEAERRALAIVQEKSPTLDVEAQKKRAHLIGIGALKYADLSHDSVRDYVFDWDKMLALDGKTAVYLQNAYVRICALYRKGNRALEPSDASISLRTPQERALGLQLLRFEGTLLAIESNPACLYRLCHYLYTLAQRFHHVYEHCPIWVCEDTTLRESRLLLSYVTAKTLEVGLSLLGVQTLSSM